MEIYDLVIVGGGPGGLSAALYGGRAQLKTILVEKAFCGGQAANTYFIENYPGFPGGIKGLDLAQRLEEQIGDFGVPIIYDEVVELEQEGGEYLVKATDNQYLGRTVIIATGTQPVPLGVPGEEEFRGRGVSYCATCDGAFFRDQDLIVVGGGDSAVEEALFLTRFARKIYLVHRRDELRATQILQEQIKGHPQVEILWNRVVEEIRGEQQVNGVILKDSRNGQKQELEASGVFIYIGSTPDTQWLKGIIQLDEGGYIPTDGRMATNLLGVFAAGDVRQTGLRQIVTAVADGAIAAVEAERYLRNWERFK
jgi:thioredoxin reductase (NADPH)